MAAGIMLVSRKTPVVRQSKQEPHMTRYASCVLSSLMMALVCVSSPARADDLSDCTQPSDMPRAIAGCSNLLATGGLSLDLATAYRNRSAAYAAMGDFERAEQDYREAVALDPAYVKSAGSEDRDTGVVTLNLSDSDVLNRRAEMEVPDRR
jgi:hypothetical protein